MGDKKKKIWGVLLICWPIVALAIFVILMWGIKIFLEALGLVAFFFIITISMVAGFAVFRFPEEECETPALDEMGENGQ